jgi:hypothetical protein
MIYKSLHKQLKITQREHHNKRQLLNQVFIVIKLTSSHVLHYDLVYLCHKWALAFSVCRHHNQVLPYSWLITGFVTRVIRRVPLVEHVFSGVRVAWSWTCCVVICISLFVLLPFFFWSLRRTCDDVNLITMNTWFSSCLLLAATLYQGNHNKNHQLWNFVPTESYVLHIQVVLGCCYINGKFTMRKLKSSLLS